MAEFCIDVLDSTVDPPKVRFETPTRTKLLGSAEALARALYERRYADGHAEDLVRVDKISITPGAARFSGSFETLIWTPSSLASPPPDRVCARKVRLFSGFGCVALRRRVA
jgi:hypothetical protein